MGYSPLLIEMSIMTEENKTETTEVEKNVDAEETSTETTEAAEEEASNIENKIDYKAITEKAKEEGYNKGRADEAYKQRNKKPTQENVEEEIVEEGDRPVTLKDLETFQGKQRQQFQNDFNTQQIQDIAGRISGSDDEKEAILAVHASRIFPENTSIQDQLTEVKLIVNKDKILGENSELKRALNSKATATKEHISGQHDSVPSNAGEPKLTGNRKEILKDFEFNKGTKQYEKKMQSGTLVHDPKTGKNEFVSNS